MDNPFLFGSDNLIKHWRSIRSQLTLDKTDLQQLEIVVEFWSKTPLSSPFLNWDSTESWVGPWEFMSEMNFDESSIAIGMEYTLLLGNDSRWTSDRLELQLILSADKSKQLLVLIVDNTYVLNFNYGNVVLLQQENNKFAVQKRYKYNNKTHKILD